MADDYTQDTSTTGRVAVGGSTAGDYAGPGRSSAVGAGCRVRPV